ncbi:MAG: hypothetical protein L0Y56_15050, partial [Nitrospira sp.]|nr:hypothetical protein [Nitrospira sp.]
GCVGERSAKFNPVTVMRYRSKLEQRLHTGPLAKLIYEPKEHTLVYAVVKTYLPDFAGSGFLLEAKGRFRTYEDARKHLAIREYNPEVDLRFVLSNPSVTAYPGSRQTLGDWLTKHGFEWCHECAIPGGWQT